MASRRRELARTDETTLSEGLRRNIELEDIASFASAKGLPIKHFLKLAKDNQKRDSFEVAVSDDNFLKPQGIKDGETPRKILQRALSVRSILSTTSSFAERMEKLKSTTEENLKLTEIGHGSFGTVYEIPGTAWCLKKTLVRPEDLWTEFVNGKSMSIDINQRAANTIMRSQEFKNALMPRVPRYVCTYGMEKGDNAKRWFAENGNMFPEENGGQKPGPINCLERILPLPEIIRKSLIGEFFPPEKQDEALIDPANKACLCRPYLGLTSKDVGQSEALYEKRPTLQNFPLYLDELEELQMDPFMIARDMALGLAAGHWAAHVNMMDVEFVIGSRPVAPDPVIKPLSKEDLKAVRAGSRRRVRNMSTTDETAERPKSFRNRAIQLWMIDYNKVRFFKTVVYPEEEYDRQIMALVDHTRATDGPYHPRAVARDEWEWDLWCEFSQTYVKASQTILEELLEDANHVGLTAASEKTTDRIMDRPRLVMKKWLEAELNETENDERSLKEFMSDVQRKGWKIPGKARRQQGRSSHG